MEEGNRAPHIPQGLFQLPECILGRIARFLRRKSRKALRKTCRKGRDLIRATVVDAKVRTQQTRQLYERYKFLLAYLYHF